MRWGVVIFPGSNCDRDVFHVIREVLGEEVYFLWHNNDNVGPLGEGDWIILPGGFSYGDYLRAGAIARLSPIMTAIKKHVERGGYVLGICNGFQILCEAGLLPGALLMNTNGRFICQPQYIRVETQNTPLTNLISSGTVLNVPIAHKEGRYFVDQKTLENMYANDQILFKYSDASGNVDDTTNPNGSVDNIAGVCDTNKQVFGMMPHPERSSESLIGGDDGLQIFKSIVKWAGK